MVNVYTTWAIQGQQIFEIGACLWIFQIRTACRWHLLTSYRYRTGGLDRVDDSRRVKAN